VPACGTKGGRETLGQSLPVRPICLVHFVYLHHRERMQCIKTRRQCIKTQDAHAGKWQAQVHANTRHYLRLAHGPSLAPRLHHGLLTLCRPAPGQLRVGGRMLVVAAHMQHGQAAAPQAHGPSARRLRHSTSTALPHPRAYMLTSPTRNSTSGAALSFRDAASRDTKLRSRTHACSTTKRRAFFPLFLSLLSYAGS